MNIPQLLLLLITLVSVLGAAYVLARDYLSKRRARADFEQLCKADRAAFRRLRHAKRAPRISRSPVGRSEVLCDRDLGNWQPEARA